MANDSKASLDAMPPTKSLRTPRTPWWWLIPMVTIVPYLLTKLHYSLPAPLPPTDVNGRPQGSEEMVLSHIRALEDIGYRTVGTEEAILGEEYVEREVRKLVERCEANGVLNCEIWVQNGQGYHMFSIMGHGVLKLYSGITNVVLKIAAKNPPSGKRAVNDTVLLGSHIDSTLPSPGAADDGMGVGVMLDIARVLIDRNEPFDNSIIFMWNGAEETLQDGSHMYSTQHPSAATVRAVINLEAAGTTGGALLFQATSREMIEAFKHAPHPRGTVIANDVFSSGIILSDTDFVQFEEYLGVTGLDMAVVGHSYFYHTRKDRIENIERGSSQHFVTNVMAIVDHLLGPDSPLGEDGPFSPPDVVYMSLYDRIFMSWGMKSADLAYVAIATLGATLALANLGRRRIKAFGLALAGAPLGLLSALISANTLATVMFLTGNDSEWFSHEGFCVALYGPAALIGQLGTQYALGMFIPASQRPILEKAHYYAQIIFLSICCLLMQSFRIRSAYLFAGLASALILGAVCSEFARIAFGTRGIHFTLGYIIPLVIFTAFGIEAFTTTLDIFVPLTGRMGKDAPTEWIIATITAFCTAVFYPIFVPLFARASPRGQRFALGGLFWVTLTVGMLFSSSVWSPYDAMHPKRMGVQYMYNHTSGEHSAHLAFMDRHANVRYAEEFHEQFGPGTELTRTVMDDYNSDWDTLYPVSSFLDTYRFPLPAARANGFSWPAVQYNASRTLQDDGNTHIELTIDHPNFIWPALAFEAEIVGWAFGLPPPQGRMRHHIKSATSYGDHTIQLNLTVKLNPDEKFQLTYSGIDVNQMVPGTASRRGPDMPASKWLTEMDAWARAKYDDSIDMCMSGVITGVIEI